MKKVFLIAGIVMFMLCSCAQEENVFSEVDISYEQYKECLDSQEVYKSNLEQQDYDNDGLIDKVSRSIDSSNNEINFILEFGDGKKIVYGPYNNTSIVPCIMAEDMDRDGNIEILFYGEYEIGTEKIISDIALYSKQEDVYQIFLPEVKKMQEHDTHGNVLDVGILKCASGTYMWLLQSFLLNEKEEIFCIYYVLEDEQLQEIELKVDSDTNEIEEEKESETEDITYDFIQHSTVYNSGYYMNNAIDRVFAEKLNDYRLPQIAYRDLQTLYMEVWKDEYETVMNVIKDKCVHEDDVERYEQYVAQVEESVDSLKALLFREMLDNYEMEESSEKNSYGNGTAARLDMCEGMIYRNACMLLVQFMQDDTYTFPSEESVSMLIEEFLQ